MSNKQAQTQAQRKQRYTPHQQWINNFAARICGIRPSGEIEWIEVEQRKAERAALKTQINWLEKTGGVL